MTGVRTFEVDDCAGDRLVAAKAGRTVSVCIPCRDEAATIGPLVSVIRRELMGGDNVVDELIVLDDRSTDDTARVAPTPGHAWCRSTTCMPCTGGVTARAMRSGRRCS